MIRTHLVKALYENLIGPKRGHDEIIEQPFGTYQVGILTSCFHTENLNNNLISDPSEKNFESKQKHSELLDTVDDNDALWPDTELSMDGSFTLGITFVIKGKLPKIQICNTWGRYEFLNKHPSEMNVFQRKTNYHLTDWIDISGNKTPVIKLENKNGNVITKSGAELHIQITKSKSNDWSWIVQVFLVNKTKYDDKDENGNPKRQNETHRIFQPQIRINVDKDSKIDYFGENNQNSNNVEEVLQYHKQRAKARGFQCSAVWKDVDPEKYDGEFGFRNFSWIDKNSDIVPKEIKSSFTCPDVRTEYIPSYSILQPEIDKRDYDAEFLAEQWDPTEIQKCLEPLTNEYKKWIVQKKSELKNNDDKLPDELIKIGYKNLDYCDKSLEEIQEGINFICSDERARLAFCFMNKIMSDKYKYEKTDKLCWKEFQMGFILQSLRGVASADNNDIADVLWFPTGGGKTEAYLGIVVFTMAYRRLLDHDTIQKLYDQRLNNDGGVNVISRYTLRLLTIQQFQRALGAILLSDLMRVKNWIPKGLMDKNSTKLTNNFLNKKFRANILWGSSRFSIGLWIGSDSTPTRFASMKGERGTPIPNAEGALRSQNKNNVKIKGNPVQIQRCPLCDNMLGFPLENQKPIELTGLWIIKTKKTYSELTSIPQSKFDHPYQKIKLTKKPQFTEITKSKDGYNFIRVELSLKISKHSELRKLIDGWWEDYVDPNFTTQGYSSLTSTCASLPGYFFLCRPGENKPYDFSIYCTNEKCILNKTEWFENTTENRNLSIIPEQFKNPNKNNMSNSVPISAFTVDEQIYSKCPTFIISTSDKFANLPWDSRCASIFGNVDCKHNYFGYGRKHDFHAPILDNKSKRIKPDLSEFVDCERFIPPSLIIQDELHLIDGALGSMVGVYEMAIDILSTAGTRHPKYISSSATIAEATKQIRTIFRRDVRIFPPRGIYSSDNFFTKSQEDVSCVDEKAGRLYIGICSAKSVFELPIKICAILMSEVHKIKENPEFYGLNKSNVDSKLDPYWTYISYFSDLQLMSRFSGFYGDDIKRDINKFSPQKMIVSQDTGMKKFGQGIRIIPITLKHDFSVYGLSIYCHKSKGKISVMFLDNAKSKRKILHRFDSKCSNGENMFLTDTSIKECKRGETVWVAITNDSEIFFRTMKQNQKWFEIEADPNSVTLDDVTSEKERNTDTIHLELTGKQRKLDEENKIEMSSETKSADLPIFLEKLQKPLLIDALFTSPVFGTGIDVNRLGLINIMTQPKTTSAYIQATGRVGRQKPALVVTWLIPRRARDLDHYENFVGYHRKIHSFVEPITANPFSDESLELSLGPIIVAILRNARSVSRTLISQEWTANTNPHKILVHKNGNSDEINAVRDALKNIATISLLPEYRKNHQFENILDNQINKWLDLVERLDGEEIIYGERNPMKPVEKNVILGTPFHELRGFSAAYHNTRNSLRDTESTSTFYHHGSNVKTSIRPSQFITRYGSGSFLPSDSCSITAQSIGDIFANLDKPIGNFLEQVDGKKGLKKIEITDPNMIKMLHIYNRDKQFNEIKIFNMPTNASLNSKTHVVKDNDGIYGAKLFPTWGICSKHLGNRILSKIIYHPQKHVLAIHCPLCKEQYKDEYSTTFSSSRFIVACKNGHMSDVSWTKEIHRNIPCSHTSTDEQRVFIWDESGSGDNVVFNCYGVWKGDDFRETTCNAQSKYSNLRYLSNEGQLQCQGKFVEDPNTYSCDASPIIARKSMLSLRSPVILSSLRIQQRHSRLFNRLKDKWDVFNMAKKQLEDIKNDWQPNDLANQLKHSQMHEGLISDIRNASKKDLLLVSEELEQTNKEYNDQTHLSETKNLSEELRSLENGVEEGSKQIKTSGSHVDASVKYPVKWESEYGFSFEAMPFSDITVTMVQTGYTREISEIIQDNRSASERMIQMRLGSMVSKYSKYDDQSTGFRWYLGNQNRGEGIFIHLDPNIHNGSNEIFKSLDGETLTAWKNVHDEVSKDVERKLKNNDLKEIERDNLEKAIIHSTQFLCGGIL